MAIVKMKHLRLAAMQSDREALLRLLQGMGCLEIEEPSVDWSDPEWAGLKSPDSGALSAAREEKNAAQHALEVLKRYAKVKGGLLSPRPVVSPQQFFEEQAYRSALETARAINDGERELAALKAERDKRAAQRASLAPWIPLELPLDTASTREVEVQFGTVSAETPFPQLAGEVQAVSELAQLTLASADRENQYLLLICHRSALDEVLEKLKEHGWSRAVFRDLTGTAADNDRRLEQEMEELSQRRAEQERRIAAQAGQREALKRAVDRASVEIDREEGKSRLVETQVAFFLEGWVPAPDEERLLKKLSEFTCCWETEDPAEEDYPEVPIKLKSNMLTEPLTTITEMYSLPAYNGVDPNGLMMPFYVFFFGFMFADLGYGLILAAVCAVIQIKTKPKGGFGQLIRLMLMCGISAAVIGFFTGGFFSDAIVQFTGMLGLPQPVIPFLSVPEGAAGVPGPLLSVMTDPMTVLIFSLAVGFVQILVGMVVQFWLLCRDGKIMDAIWDVGTWWVIFAGIALFALNMTGISNVGSAGGIPVVLIIGVVMLLAQGRSAKGFGRVTAVISAIYNGVTGYFGDILSYSRLMVMMLASSVIGQVFNILGAMPGRRRDAQAGGGGYLFCDLPCGSRLQHRAERHRNLRAHLAPAVSGIF